MSYLVSNTGIPRIRWTLKVNNISLVLGNTVSENARLSYIQSKGFNSIQLYGLYSVFGNTTAQNNLASFISRARSNYGILNVGCIMGRGNSGFISALSYNNSVPAISRFNDFNKENEFWNYFRVDFRVTVVSVGYTYSITLNGTTYSYTALIGDTLTSIATALAAACAPSGLTISLRTSSVFNDTVVIKSTASIYTSFTYTNSGNISSDNVNENYTSWINSLMWLKANIGSNGTISAYVANPAGNWGLTEATAMCTYLDIYEGTNYTTSPNEAQGIYRNNQMIYIAQAASNLGKVQNHCPIFSAEYISPPPGCGEANFMGLYLQTNGITTANSTWKTQYYNDLGLSKTNLNLIGYNYFSYNCLSYYVP
jgi:hypothetical protein